MRILIVEDEYSLAELVSNRLKKEKYTVDICNDGEDGLYNASRCRWYRNIKRDKKE